MCSHLNLTFLFLNLTQFFFLGILSAELVVAYVRLSTTKLGAILGDGHSSREKTLCIEQIILLTTNGQF